MCLGVWHLSGEGVGIGGVPEVILGGVVAKHPPSIDTHIYIGTDSGGREQGGFGFCVADGWRAIIGQQQLRRYKWASAMLSQLGPRMGLGIH